MIFNPMVTMCQVPKQSAPKQSAGMSIVSWNNEAEANLLNTRQYLILPIKFYLDHSLTNIIH